MENPIQQWISSDKKLSDLLVEIQSMNKTPVEQAEIAFDRLCEMYELPKMPEDLENNGTEYERSVFEEHSLLKFLAPNDDPRGLVLSSIYHLWKNLVVDYQDIAEKEFGSNIPENCQIEIKGEGINGQVVFPSKEGKSWFDLGCIVNTKLS
ncbi:MAG: hypothetical protein KJO52_05240 [Maribacter sp.]|nr:hypothetical protein [Maribacter sp.]